MWYGILKNKTVSLFTDNQNAYYTLKKGWSTSSKLAFLARSIWLELWRHDIRVVSTYWLPSKINVEADAISRQPPDRMSDWALTEKYFQLFIQKLRSKDLPLPTVDAFATRLNRRLPRYCSLYRDLESLGDFFLADLKGEILWCNPPFNMVARVLRHIRLHELKAYVLVPVWPGRLWWPHVAVQRYVRVYPEQGQSMFLPRVARPVLDLPHWPVRIAPCNI